MKKKVTSVLLTAAMVTGMLSGTAVTVKAEKEAGLPPMTDEEIELTYMNFDNKVLTEYLAEKFMEKYPNIKVNVIYEPAGDTYNDTLLNLVNRGKTPDCFMILGNCDFALSNKLLGDMTEYWENDP